MRDAGDSTTTFYRASRLDDVVAPPPGEDFDPYRDTRYSRVDVATIEAAIAYASKDYHECGRVEERMPIRGLVGVSEVISEWMVFPDGTTERVEP